MEIENINIDDLIEYENNAKEHPEYQIEQIITSIEKFGFNDPIAVDENNVIIEGHGRLYALRQMGYDEVPCIRLKHLTEEQKKAYILAHNKLTMNSGFDIDLLDIELESIKGIDMSSFGFEINIPEMGEASIYDKIHENPIDSNLFSDFGIPPFSIFDTRQKVWQDRKKYWLNLGIKSEVGRDDNLVFSSNLSKEGLKGTSVFDPVLCEVSYSWFTPKENNLILDPFAGGSVRGILAEKLGYRYTGCDLRQEQIDANIVNAKELNCDLNKINWICDDSQNIDEYVKEKADLLFTCPPYFDLEVYSDNEKDISNVSYEEFEKIYTNILQKSANLLNDNRFAIVVISDVRDNKGYYRDLTGLTKKAFADVGVYFYNDIILLNSVGSGALRARKSMNNRKVVRMHQNVLVFYKGNPKKIQENFNFIKNIDFSCEEDSTF